MLKIHQIFCPVGQKLTIDKIARKIHCRPSDIRSFEIERESLDARHSELMYSYAVYADVKNEEKYLKQKDVRQGHKEEYIMPDAKKVTERPVVAGFGPSGMFAALILAECGCRPIVIERGKAVEERAEDVELFFKEGILDPESNVQYGEGGAGTFSDGKLTTRIKNYRIQKVLEEFTEAGADPAILYQAMPHLGTDVLRTIVRNIREKIIRLGGEVHFETRLEAIRAEDGCVRGIVTNHGEIPCTRVILCLGHSAQDTYRKLYDQGIRFQQKDFAVGVRAEHPQAMIDQSQYGSYAGHPALSAASYRLSHTSSVSRGVYSFCMCPGGVVIPASTEPETLAVNGMSYSARDGKNANSAILVQVPRKDFDHGHPLDGFAYQHQLEVSAYRNGYRAPYQNIRDFMNGEISSQEVIPSSYPRGLEAADLRTLFDEEINVSFREAFENFDHKIPGFIEQGLMVGMESRSSSPVRMPRTDEGTSETCGGLYPCGEGAGYAGGIVSSAVDGIRQAENLIRSY